MAESVGKICLEVKGYKEPVCVDTKEGRFCGPKHDCPSVYICADGLSEFFRKFGAAVSKNFADGCRKFAIKIPQPQDVAIKIPRPSANITTPATAKAAEKTEYTPAGDVIRKVNYDLPRGPGGCF